jgi:trans-2,3-dihydro-3-hydroxyanthranilate isomerase
MVRHEYRTVDVFTTERFGGNPLAVFPEGEGIDPADMQRIASELNLSETTFVLPSDRAGCDCRVRIFTPRLEVPMAGHPTIGTAFVLDLGDRMTFEEGIGPIEVERIRAPDGATMWRMTQPEPRWGAALEAKVAAELLSLTEADIAPLPVEVISTGLPLLFVPLRGVEALGRARLRPDRWDEASAATGSAGVFCFTIVDPHAATVRSRMFAPDAGVAEDPATGSASGPLGCYLVRHGVVPAANPARIVSLQGVEMGRPSRIHIEIDGGPGQITGVRVAGACIAVGGGYVET